MCPLRAKGVACRATDAPPVLQVQIFQDDTDKAKVIAAGQVRAHQSSGPLRPAEPSPVGAAAALRLGCVGRALEG